MPQHFGGGGSPFLIAGPCVVESDDLNLRVGEALADLALKLGLHVIYKASYDKANRARLKGPRGPGAERGLAALAKVRAATGLPILTDVHETSHVSAAAQVADVLQIPAFLCRQTDLLVAAGRAGRYERSEEHTSELQSHSDLVCRLLLEKKKKQRRSATENNHDRL